jgi:hypothetical protein
MMDSVGMAACVVTTVAFLQYDLQAWQRSTRVLPGSVVQSDAGVRTAAALDRALRRSSS